MIPKHNILYTHQRSRPSNPLLCSKNPNSTRPRQKMETIIHQQNLLLHPHPPTLILIHLRNHNHTLHIHKPRPRFLSPDHPTHHHLTNTMYYTYLLPTNEPIDVTNERTNKTICKLVNSSASALYGRNMPYFWLGWWGEGRSASWVNGEARLIWGLAALLMSKYYD